MQLSLFILFAILWKPGTALSSDLVHELHHSHGLLVRHNRVLEL